jgi:hypothetical protein
MKRKTIVDLMCLVVIVTVLMVAGCLEQNQVGVEQVRTYADPITENILLAMNEDNYTKYSEHFDATMKNALPETSSTRPLHSSPQRLAPTSQRSSG